MRKEMRYDIYDLADHAPGSARAAPAAPRGRRARDGRRGGPAAARPRGARAGARRRSQAEGVEAVAVTFLHSYRNPEHERAARRLAARAPSRRRRLALVGGRAGDPRVRADVDHGRQRLRAAARGGATCARSATSCGTRGSSGTSTSCSPAAASRRSRRPSGSRCASSSPALPPASWRRSSTAELVGDRDLVTFDMGGTTAKMCLIKDGQPEMASTFEIARVHRFKRGSGLPVQVRSIELIEIGAGGGSIARVDELGLLKVGPASRGRRPRPGLLRPRRDATDGHRCRPRARLPQPGELPRRPHAAVGRRRRGGDSDGHRGADGDHGPRGRLGHPPGREREHDRGDAHPRRRARRRRPRGCG